MYAGDRRQFSQSGILTSNSCIMVTLRGHTTLQIQNYYIVHHNVPLWTSSYDNKVDITLSWKVLNNWIFLMQCQNIFQLRYRQQNWTKSTRRWDICD